MTEKASKLKLKAMSARAMGDVTVAAPLFLRAATIHAQRAEGAWNLVEARGLTADAMGCLSGTGGGGRMVIALERALAEICQLVVCPSCRVRVGRPCRNQRLGVLPRAHSARVKRAREEL